MQFDWKSYFIFTSKEQKGIVVLGCILSLSLLLHYLLPSTNTEVDRFSNAKNKPKALFYFDPNFLITLKLKILEKHHIKLIYVCTSAY